MILTYPRAKIWSVASSTGELKVLENVGHGSVLQRPDLTSKYFLEWHKKILGA
jgi:hypothetical protein